MIKRELPSDLTSYDLFKTYALILMAVDHLGYYFFPEDEWWRIAGRTCVPIWFFLIGYARSRDLGLRLWVGATILCASSFVVGMPVFPINILGTMIFIRLIIDPVMNKILYSRQAFWGFNLTMAALAIPSAIIFEYGTLGVIMAVYGYLLRRKEEIDEKYGFRANELLQTHFIFAFACFTVIQQLSFLFSDNGFIALSVAIVPVMVALYFFRPATYPQLTRKLPRPLVKILQITGRRTLEFYVLHLLAFKFTALLTGDDRFGWWQWTWL